MAAMTKTKRPARYPARAVRARDRRGRLVTLDSLPLVTFVMRCGHQRRDFGVEPRDIVFCDRCGAQSPVTRILDT